MRSLKVLVLVGWALCLVGSLRTPAQAVPWLGGMTIPLLGAGFLWGLRGSAWLGGASLLVGLILVMLGMPPGFMAGPWTAFLLIPFLLWGKECWFHAETCRCEGSQESSNKRHTNLKSERDELRMNIRAQEEAIQGISDLYGLSKSFLGTLDLKEALAVTEDALSKWLPSSENQGRVLVKKIRALIESNTVSMEALSQILPSEGTDPISRERWGIVSGQLALGLRRVSLYTQVQEAAIHDGLTGLLVRRHFRERLEEEVARRSRRFSSLAFLMIDLDHFKKINDTYGHLVGDVVLREVARLIRRSVREIDLVGRYGGEEFAVALPEADRTFAVQIANRIRQAIEAALVQAYDETVRVSVSIGVALCPENARTADHLIEQADQAMYEAKKMGRNKTVAQVSSSTSV